MIIDEWPNNLNATEIALSFLAIPCSNNVVWTVVEKDLLSEFFGLMISKVKKLVKDDILTMRSQLLSFIREISLNLGLEFQF